MWATLNAAAEVTLTIHNVKGQLVRSLVDGKLAAGNYSHVWDGRDHQERTATDESDYEMEEDTSVDDDPEKEPASDDPCSVVSIADIAEITGITR